MKFACPRCNFPYRHRSQRSRCPKCGHVMSQSEKTEQATVYFVGMIVLMIIFAIAAANK